MGRCVRSDMPLLDVCVCVCVHTEEQMLIKLHRYGFNFTANTRDVIWCRRTSHGDSVPRSSTNNMT